MRPTAAQVSARGANVKDIGRAAKLNLTAGALFLFAGFRDWVAPGFLSIAGRHRASLGDVALDLAAGVLFVAAALRTMVQREGI